MNGQFSVTWARVNEREAMQGGTSRHGLEDEELTLREALAVAHGIASRASEAAGVYANDSQAGHARWVTFEYREYETGDTVEAAVHFPPTATPASRARLVRVLTGARA